MTRLSAVEEAGRYYDSGTLLDLLRRRVARPTESQAARSEVELRNYLAKDIGGELSELGFSWHIVDNPSGAPCPFLIAERKEDEALPTLLIYGHGDTVLCDAENWTDGLAPLDVSVRGDRWYGRGIADNKGQHSINLLALRAVLSVRGGRLGFNVKILMEMGEEIGSPGLHALCRERAEELACDVLIASDGPRLSADVPTLFLGSRGMVNIILTADLRSGAHHSGNWGGLLRNPGTMLANAIATLVSDRGAILVEGLRPPPIPATVREALKGLSVGNGPGDPAIDENWGEPGLTKEERVFGWNTLEVLAYKTGNPERPLSAIPGIAKAKLQLRYVVGTQIADIGAILRAHFDRLGLHDIAVEVESDGAMAATRTDPKDPWVRWALASINETTGKHPALLPNLGGSLPNDAFADILGVPTLWVPHSHPGCAQHAPNEHMLGSVARDGLTIFAGLLWDLAENSPAAARSPGREPPGFARQTAKDLACNRHLSPP